MTLVILMNRLNEEMFCRFLILLTSLALQCNLSYYVPSLKFIFCCVHTRVPVKEKKHLTNSINQGRL